TGDIIVKNANYTIKVVDAQTGGPIPNALVNCDGYKMTTDAFGMARLTLPVNVMIQITASKNLYAPTTAFATRLSSSGINTISLRYVGDGSNCGSGSGSGSGGNGGFGGGINVAGYSFSMPGVEAPTVTATGPNSTVHGKTSPAFKVELGMNLPYSKLSFKFDPDKQTLKILINAKIEAEYGSSGYEAKFENKFDSVLDKFDKFVTGKDKDSWRSDFEKKQAQFGLSGEVTFGGYAVISFASGSAQLTKGGFALGMKSTYSTPKYPIWGLFYWQLQFSGGVNGEYQLKLGEGNVFQWPGETSVSLGITGKLGIGDLLGLVKAEGGLKVNGKTKITTPVVSMENSVKATADITIFAEFKALLWSDKVSKPLKEWQIWPKQKDITEIDFTPYMRNDAMKLISRDYLNQTGSLRAIGDESLVMNSVFPYGEPQLCQLDDGRYVLVWVHDDGTRTDENRTALYYSICDNGTWSEPAIVWDDGTADFSPVIAADGNNVHIVWQNVSEVLPEGATIDTAITKTQICYTKLNWDGTIATPYVVDTAGRYQANICMAAENGNVIVAWKENSSNNIWNETGSYYPYYCKMQNGSWSSPYYYTSYSLITEMACGFVNGQPSYAFVYDADGNATTVTDLEVYRVYPNSSNSPTRLTNNSVIDSNIQYVAGDLYWRQDNELRNAGGSLGLMSEDDLTLAVAPDGSLVAVIKSVVDGFNTELYGSFQNASGEWSVPAPITNYYGAIRSFSPIVCDDGSIAIALDNAGLQEIEQDGDEAYGTTSMHVIVGSSLTDLNVTSGMYYDVDAVTPGEDLPMTVTVYNNSIGAVNGVKAELYNANNELVCTLNSDETVECGEEKEITFNYPVPEELTLTEYTVKVLPTSVDDDIPDNNETSVTIGYADVAIENGRFNRTEIGATVEADITNSGFTAADNVVASLRYQGVDGDFLGSIDLGTLAVGANEHVSFNIPATYLENNDELDLNTFYLYIETDTEEAHAYNNSETIVDEPIRVTDILLNIHEKDMLVHETLQLTATIMPLDAANQLVRWASTNVDVATVDENGLVSCVGEGTATIYAISADGIFSEGCVINAEYPYYTVTFLDDDGTVLKTEQVKETDDATPPEVADRVGWSFVGWDGDYTNISGDVTLTAQYQ
ncbi:MAG: Ig-like domain-containing protein, partial [Clostridia bacterium]|nr:Ig-like domain-containing protein [Clostridia bacterium]